MENFGKFITAITTILATIIGILVRGFVITKLWIWFIVPIFETTPLRLVEAIGLSFIIGFIIYRKSSKSDDGESFWAAFVSSIVETLSASIFALLFGWIIQLFI